MVTLPASSKKVTAQCLPVMNLSRPPFAGGSSSLSGVPAKPHVPKSPLASGDGFASALGCPPSAQRPETKAIRIARANEVARRVPGILSFDMVSSLSDPDPADETPGDSDRATDRIARWL